MVKKEEKINISNKILFFIISLIVLSAILFYYYFFIQSGIIVALISTFIMYYIFFFSGIVILWNFIKERDAQSLIISHCLIVLGIFVILYLINILQILEIQKFFDYMNSFVMGSFSLVITSFLFPEAFLKNKNKLSNEIRVCVLLTTLATIIFFVIGFAMVVTSMFGSSFKDNQYIVLESFFLLGSIDLVFPATILLGYVLEKMDIKFKKFKWKK